MSYHHGDLRNALVEAGLALLDEGGVDALTLRAAARHAGVSSAAPYRHFEDRTALMAAVAEAGFRGLAESMATVPAQDPASPFERVNALGERYLEFACTHPARFRLMFGRKRPALDDHQGLRESARETYRGLRHAVAHCPIAPERISEVTDLCWACVHGLATLAVDRQLDDARARSVRGLLASILENEFKKSAR